VLKFLGTASRRLVRLIGTVIVIVEQHYFRPRFRVVARANTSEDRGKEERDGER